MAITKLKSGQYRADWRVDGVRKRRTFQNKVQAERFLAEQTLFDSSSGRAHQAINPKQMTVRELAERYSKDHLALTRAPGNKSYIDRIIVTWGDCKLFRVSKAGVTQWIMSYLTGPVDGKRFSVAYAKKLLCYFKRIFNWGRQMEIVSDNPIAEVSFRKEFKRANKRNVVLEPEQFWDLVSKLPQKPPYLRQVTVAAWHTGMRIGEIIRLKWSCVDSANHVIRLDADETKESDTKVIGIEPDLWSLLTELRQKTNAAYDDLVFTSTVNKPIDHHCLDRAFRKYADRAGYRNVRLHDLRHSYTRRKRREGFDRSVIKAQQGHHTDSMFHWYDKVDVEEIQAMAGYTAQNMAILDNDIAELVKKARKSSIPLGAVQNLVGRLWREES